MPISPDRLDPIKKKAAPKLTPAQIAAIDAAKTAYEAANAKYKTSLTAYQGALDGANFLAFSYPKFPLLKVEQNGTTVKIFVKDDGVGGSWDSDWSGERGYIWGSKSQYDTSYLVTLDSTYNNTTKVRTITCSSTQVGSTSTIKTTILGGWFGVGRGSETSDGWWADVLTKWKAKELALLEKNGKYRTWQALKSGAPITATSADDLGGGDTTTTQIVTPPSPEAPVEYNLPAVKTTYFNNDNYYKDKVLLTAGGQPLPRTIITNAMQLWNTSNDAAHKGMIQTYAFWSSQYSKNKDPNLADLGYYNKGLFSKKHGFQFIYNPNTVEMFWGGTPPVDVGYVMSGKDNTPYIVPSSSSSTIGFSLVLNRVNDLSLIQNLGVAKVAAASDQYYGQTATTADIQTIANRGTMYDIEYLLKTLVGFEMYSRLRGYNTADIGFLMGYTVELHLGKDLRYLGNISGFNVHHSIFTKDMIPVYTTINITLNRRIEPQSAPSAESTASTRRSGGRTIMRAE